MQKCRVGQERDVPVSSVAILVSELVRLSQWLEGGAGIFGEARSSTRSD